MALQPGVFLFDTQRVRTLPATYSREVHNPCSLDLERTLLLASIFFESNSPPAMVY